MHIGRKQALFAFVSGIVGAVPFLSRRALAQDAIPLAPAPAQPAPLQPLQPINVQQTQLEELKKRVATLEAALANQAAFTKDAAGNLTLMSNGNITLAAGANLSLKASAQGSLVSTAGMKIAGATINLN